MTTAKKTRPLRKRVGGDLLVGGGAHRCESPEEGSKRPDEAFERSIAETVPGILEGIEDAGTVNGWAGFDAATPDARPSSGQFRTDRRDSRSRPGSTVSAS